jgi:hypothetical protein
MTKSQKRFYIIYEERKEWKKLMGNCGKMDPELPENSYEMVPDKEERKDEEVEWYSLLCNVFIIPHVSYITHQTA